jgi:hypothetical protein
MRHWLAVVVALAGGVLGGCVSEQPERSTARLHAPGLAGPVGEDVVYLDVAEIERPAGDAFLNRDLWSDADEQVVHVEGDDPSVSLERKTALEKNGFRIAQIGGLQPPEKLQDLLLSQRNCKAHRIQLHADHDTTIPLGPTRKQCRYRLHQEGQSVALEFQNAQCFFEVMTSLAEEGRVSLRFTPHVKHGELNTAFTPLRDAAGVLRWGRQEQQPEEIYPELSWTVTTAINEYVVIGTACENGETLGEQFFLSSEDNPGRQRLLVLRATHVPSADRVTQGRSPPLALRASWTAVRGRGE